MVFDCHIHYDPRIFTLERMLACMEKHGIDRAALIPTMVEPFSLAGKMQQAGSGLLRFGLLHAAPAGRFFYGTLVDGKGNFVLLGKKYRIYDRPDNAPVAEVIKKHPDRFVGWIFVNPAAGGDPVAELEEWCAHPGMIGVKTHPFWHGYPTSSLDPVASWCAQRGYPILIHLGSKGGSGDYRRLPEKYPDLKVLYAHAGIPYYGELWSYIKGKRNVYIDLSSPYLNRELVRGAVDFLGADKCLYGTDGPYGEQGPGEDFDYGSIKGWIESMNLPDKDLAKIFNDNFQGIMKA